LQKKTEEADKLASKVAEMEEKAGEAKKTIQGRIWNNLRLKILQFL
jgi:uncharacterized protein Yka (UPF0111/DUF47 family)